LFYSPLQLLNAAFREIIINKLLTLKRLVNILKLKPAPTLKRNHVAAGLWNADDIYWNLLSMQR